ncbi:uncharacterized protein RHOBADRAFT_50909 [Rhodotorula graminis WP1]|uniref:Uncharacterized protein n=1 Tax=Rhodotorula graminis (strain WP1) TaxID=578459 RepID=A0A194SCX4_RHOGW|nr:uncharacterized protein RHOBADRAFT_50909 [Rhodotorula graminis WP1]KPV78442.1 hypothetical protein RHOBADRAFT_50909 [Rhodotorula graminis WP1]
MHWVALLRYEYSESRRPRPSALHHLAYGTNRRIRRAALPLLCRQPDEFEYGTPQQVWMPGEGLVDRDNYARAWRQARQLSAHPPSSQTRLELVAYHRLANIPPLPFHHVKHLELRRPVPEHIDDKVASAYLDAFPALTSLKVVEPGEFFLRDLRLADLSLVVRPRASINMSSLSSMCRGLRRLEIEVVRRPRPGEPVVKFPLVVFLRENTFPIDSILRDLSLSVRLDPTLRSFPQPMRPIVEALRKTFGSCRLTSLSLDDYTTCAPQDLAVLATTFPTLECLSLPDRTTWDGSRADLLAALEPLTALKKLSCRLLPVTPASTYDTPPSATSSPATLAADDAQEPDTANDAAAAADDDALFASPHAIALEAAAHLPHLELVGFIGQHCGTEWVRVYRDERGRPDAVEGVRLVEMDLDRP